MDGDIVCIPEFRQCCSAIDDLELEDIEGKTPTWYTWLTFKKRQLKATLSSSRWWKA
jgi:hypothetical protein